MDLSAVIFVVLAIGWAVYLIPKALKHHEDVDRSRPVEEFSDSVRVIGRGAVAAARSAAATATAPAAPVARTHAVTREAARAAAKRRRRVLGGLLVVLVAVSATSYLGYTPWWSTAIPGGLIVAFLITARLTVRAQQVRRVAPVQQATSAEAVETRDSQPVSPAEVEADLGGEDTVGLSRAELADAVAAPVLDEGGLWDPLPVTLPTYVNKARARRTVRTIELTGGSADVTSSGHDAADSALAREAEEAAAAAAETAVEAEERKAAGA